MILRGWHIDRFGLFRDSRVEGLGDGVTVIQGPNEAGKSTLLAFIRGVLFGFADRRSKTKVPLYEPRDGTRPAGRLFLESGGQRYTVARGESRRNQLTITDDSGAELPEGELLQLLGGADATLFRNVFGFSLYELQELDTLTAESVRDRIFSGAVAGAGRSARHAAQELDNAASALYRPDGRARNNRVAELLGELRRLSEELDTAKRDAEAYPELLEAETEAAAEVARLRDSLREMQRRRDRLDALLRLWDPWSDRAAALDALEADGRARFGRRAEVRPDPGFTELARRSEELHRSLEAQRERLARAAALEAERDETAGALAAALDTLGAGWTAERVADFRLPIPTREEVRAWESALSEAAAARAKAEETRQAAERAHDETRQAAEACHGALEDFGTPPAEIPALQQRQSALERLRGRVGELARARQEASHAKSLAEERRKRLADLEAEKPGRSGFAVALAVALLGIALALGGAALAGEPMVGAAGLLAVAVAVLIALQAKRRQARAQDRIDAARTEVEAAERAAESAQDACDSLAEEVAEAARGLDLPDAPGEAEIAVALTQLGHDLQRRRDWDSRTQQAEDADAAQARAAKELETARTAEEAAKGARDRQEADWLAWKRHHDFPEHLSPPGVLDFAAQVGEGQKLQRQKARQDNALTEVKTAVAAWEEAARAVLRQRGGAAEGTGEALILAFNDTAAAIRAEQDAYRRIGAAEDALAREGGHDAARIAELRETLADGDAEAWRQERGDLAERLEAAEQAVDEAVRRHHEAQRRREAVERSDRIAELETRRNALAQQVETAYRRWQALTLSRRLILDTLDAYERERQPAVFADAGASLARVTGGRYTGIVQDEDGAGFYVLDADGRRVPPIDLSRGTREQLYLAVRLGLVAEFRRRGTALPLIMDEILVNFDAERMQAMARELRTCAETHQVLLFTCHGFVAEAMQAVAPDTRVLSVASLRDGAVAAAQ